MISESESIFSEPLGFVDREEQLRTRAVPRRGIKGKSGSIRFWHGETIAEASSKLGAGKVNRVGFADTRGRDGTRTQHIRSIAERTQG
jgi:hypothetical protein